jgi:hypothetical protein
MALRDVEQAMGKIADHFERIEKASQGTKAVTLADNSGGAGFYGGGGALTPAEALANTPQGAGIARAQSDTRGTGGAHSGNLGPFIWTPGGIVVNPNATPADFLAAFGSGIANGGGGGAAGSGGAGSGILGAFNPNRPGSPAPGSPLPGTPAGGITISTNSPDVVLLNQILIAIKTPTSDISFRTGAMR